MNWVRTVRGTVILVGLYGQNVLAQTDAFVPATAPAPVARQRDIVTVGSMHGGLLTSLLSPSVAPQAQVRTRSSVDLGPVVNGALAFVQKHGFPLQFDPELSGENGFVFSAAFQFDPTMPPMQLHIGDGGPLDAFYANEGGFRLALGWTLPWAKQLALNLAAGEDSEFGNWAIAGVQWRDPKRPLAIGIGMPVALSNADGDIGVICQLRMLLD